MFQVATFVRLGLLAVTLAVTPLSARAVEADISGSLSGRFNLDNGSGADVFGFGKLPHLGKSILFADLVFSEYLIPYVEEIPELVFDLSDLELVSANGDLIAGICGPTMYDSGTGRLSWDLTFYGGTGRFADAIGVGKLVVQLPANWEFFDSISNDMPVEFELIDVMFDY